MTRRTNQYLQINEIEQFIQSKAREEFMQDKKEHYAVIRALEIIGEAANRISDDLAQKYPDFPWLEARGLRNVIVHEYFDVDLGIIWDTVKDDLPKIKSQLIEMLRNEDQ